MSENSYSYHGHCGRCGGNGYLMRVHDKVMLKCDACEGSGKDVPHATTVEVMGHPDQPVSARCILSGCQDTRRDGPSRGTYDLQDMETFCTLAASKIYEACLQAVEGEQLQGETKDYGDEIYMRAVNDCIEALKRLPINDARDATGGGTS